MKQAQFIRKPQDHLWIPSLVVLLVGFLVMFPDLVLLVVVVPKFATAFASQNQALPAPTATLVGIPTLVYIALFVAIAGALVLKEVIIARKKITLTINIVALICGFIFIPFSVLALFLPMVAILRKIGGQ